MKKAVIIGAGVGGLACGIHLLHAGFEVIIYEKTNTAGGVSKRIQPDGSPVFFDSFASITIEPASYRQIFSDAGLNPDDYMKIKPLKDLYKAFYSDGSSYVFSANDCDPVSFEAFFNEPYCHYEAFLKKFSDKYALADSQFLTRSFLTKREIYNWDILSSAFRLHPFFPASVSLSSIMKSPKLKEYLLFQTFFMGVSPYRLSNLYAAIPAMTKKEGLIMIQGGMGGFVEALHQAFLDLGGKIFFSSEVTKICIENKTASGILVNNQMIPADIVISNADYYHTKYELFRPYSKKACHFQKSDRLSLLDHAMSCSVFLLRLALKGQIMDLHVHNLYLTKDFKEEMRRISKGMLPEDPPLYLYYPAAEDDSFYQNGCTPLTIMMRVPNLSSKSAFLDSDTLASLRKICLDALCSITKDSGILNQIAYETYSTPSDLKEDFHYTHGAAFGIAHNYTGSIMFRPQIKIKHLKNVYCCGCNIHPGNGVSIVLKGAKILGDELIKTFFHDDPPPS